MSPISGSEADVIREELVFLAEDIRLREWKPLGGQAGVTIKVLWEDATERSSSGIIRIEPGRKILPHTHAYAVHHVWVAEGACTVGERRLESGSYCFVPAGVLHGIDEAGWDGCTLFYVSQLAEID